MAPFGSNEAINGYLMNGASVFYKIKLKPSSSSDVSDDEYEFVVNDIRLSLAERLSINEKCVSTEVDGIVFDSNLSEKDIKEKLKDIFKHHFDIVRYVGIDKLS